LWIVLVGVVFTQHVVVLKAMNLVEELSRNLLKAYITSTLKEITEAPHILDVVRDPDRGYVVVITLEANARRALGVWLKLQEKFKGIPIVVKWTGPNDISEEELVNYMVKILNAGGFKARASQGFSAVEAVKEVREE
jgi:hypothetical protein